MFKGENWELLKYAFGMGSKIFTVMVMVNAVNAWFAGEIDANYMRVFNQFAIVLVCIAVVFLFEKLKSKMWLKIVASYSAMLALSSLFTWIVGLMGEGTTSADFLRSIMTNTIIYVIVFIVSLVIEHKEKGEKEKNAE
ncbi:MAG: hypothetical protein FWB98_06465 [Defluviitaleaceae bacterium]|nr:hypothetical protein [Defluviitaleaceae bacterium]